MQEDKTLNVSSPSFCGRPDHGGASANPGPKSGCPKYEKDFLAVISVYRPPTQD